MLLCPRSTEDPDNRVDLIRLLVPERLQQNYLHHHTSLEGVHQEEAEPIIEYGPTFTDRDQSECPAFLGECVDCTTGKRRPILRGESPGNLQATYPFQINAMDNICRYCDLSVEKRE